jgi:hypothetical protein
LQNLDIWDVPFYYDTFDADNDSTDSADEESDSSNEDSDEEVGKARKQLKEVLAKRSEPKGKKMTLSYVIKMEKSMLKREQGATKERDENGKEKMNLWTEAHRCISENRLDKDEYTGPMRDNKDPESEEEDQEESKTEKANKKANFAKNCDGDSTSDSEESDEDMSWYRPNMDPDTYFVFVNNNRVPFEKGT